jgi:hypothetical protein
MSKVLITFLIINLLAFPIAAQECETTNSIWISALNQQLGIKPDSEPNDGEVVRFVSATVTNFEKLFALGLYGVKNKLFALGLYGVKNGDKIKLINLGNNQWRIKHYATGLAIILTINPPKSAP